MIGQLSQLERKSIEPMALNVEDGNVRSMQRFISDMVWDDEKILEKYHGMVAEDIGDPLMQSKPLYKVIDEDLVFTSLRRIWFKCLNRRSQRKGFNWEEFRELLKRYPLPEPRIRKTYKWIHSAS